MNNSYITIIKEKRTALSRKRVPLNQNECTDDFRIGVPFEQNLQQIQEQYELKLHMFEKYGLNKNKEFMDDFAFYYVAEWGFAGILFRNTLAGPIEERKDSLKRIVRLSCLSDNYKKMGKRIFLYGKRNAAFWFACKHHIDFVIEKMALKIFEK